MKSWLWKTVVVVLVLMIILIMGINRSFTSYAAAYPTQNYGENGTIIIVAVAGGLAAHGKFTVVYQGVSAGQPHIILPNGSSVTVSSDFSIYFNFTYVPFSGQTYQSGGAANLTVSPSSPIDAGVIYNVQASYLETAINEYRSNGINSYAIFVQNFSTVRVVVVGGL
jgi:hypothetical protein